MTTQTSHRRVPRGGTKPGHDPKARAEHDPGHIANDPSRPDDSEYILRLLGQVMTVSLETMEVVKALPEVESG